MKNKVVIATSNKHKFAEMQECLISIFDVVYSLTDLGISIDAEETGSTFLENSKIKALDISRKVNLPVIADDSGLSICSLNDFPGIYSSRFMENESYENKCKEIIRLLEDKIDRSAYYTCAITFIDKKRDIFKQIERRSEGCIVKEYKKREHGFGYDPIFFSDEAGEIFGNISTEEKFKYSHRGKAIRDLVSFLRELYS